MQLVYSTALADWPSEKKKKNAVEYDSYKKPLMHLLSTVVDSRCTTVQLKKLHFLK